MSKFKFIIIEHSKDTVRFRIKKKDQYLSFQEVFKLWDMNPTFIEFYKDELIQLNFQAFYWEHPALTKDFLHKDYECILQKSKPLEHLKIDERSFANYINNKEQVIDFRNLGSDARLVVPTKKTDDEIYNHMGKFIRFAKKEQIIEVFKRIGQTIIEEVETQKYVWLNTAGLGVIWLHIRMDTRPKYYKTVMYKRPDFVVTK